MEVANSPFPGARMMALASARVIFVLLSFTKPN
jgi:hypothetical protein